MDIDPLTIYRRENKFGTTSFHYTCLNRSYDLMEYMIQNSSNRSINMKNTTDGTTAHHFACWTGGRDYDAIHVETLLQFPDIDVNVQANYNVTPLHMAALNQTETHAFEKLFEHPFIDINSKDVHNKTPFDYLQQ